MSDRDRIWYSGAIAALEEFYLHNPLSKRAQDFLLDMLTTYRRNQAMLPLDAQAARYRTDLENVRQRVVPMGLDSGDTGSLAIIDAALEGKP